MARVIITLQLSEDEDRKVRVRTMYPSEEGENAVGLYWDHLREIALDATLPAQEQAAILIHEVIHAVWSARKMGKRVTEESACTHLGVALAEVFRDNPHLVSAITSALWNNTVIVT